MSPRLPVPAHCSTPGMPLPAIISSGRTTALWGHHTGAGEGRWARSPRSLVAPRAPSWPGRSTYFAVRADGGAQELPGATPAVHPEHAQDLQETQAPQGRGQDIALVAHGDHRHGGDQHEDVWGRKQSASGQGRPGLQRGRQRQRQPARERVPSAAAGNGDGDRAWRAGPLSRGRGGNATCQGLSKSP